jgi:prepilin-type N-terminal cleavage/methylation domain-containing protein
MKRYQRGFTLIELIIAVGSVVALGALGGVIYVLFHFIAKFW